MAGKIKEAEFVSVEEYFDIDHNSQERYEYIAGEIYLMVGGSLAHSEIIPNLTREISLFLRGKPCRVCSSDLKVRADDETYLYPDLTVVCDKPQLGGKYGDVLQNPKIIFEVLSPSTEQNDRTTKFLRYQQIETLNEYILVHQDKPMVEQYTRTADGWLHRFNKGIEAEVKLQSISFTLQLFDIYDRVFENERE